MTTNHERAKALLEEFSAHLEADLVSWRVPRWTDLQNCIAAALDEREREVREEDARLVEEHRDHIDLPSNTPQDHVEPPFRCCVAAAIRARQQGSEGKEER